MFSIEQRLTFPAYTGININMMPIVAGDPSSVPSWARQYDGVIAACRARGGDTVYLTVHESFVSAGRTQRRPGAHTDATSGGPWGGGWGGKKDDGAGIWMASTDGACLLWDEEVDATEVDGHGALLRAPRSIPTPAEPGVLYHMSDRTPHASVPSVASGRRQFFRLVGPKIHVWYARHSTPNPLGVPPRAPVVTTSKFQK